MNQERINTNTISLESASDIHHQNNVINAALAALARPALQLKLKKEKHKESSKIDNNLFAGKNMMPPLSPSVSLTDDKYFINFYDTPKKANHSVQPFLFKSDASSFSSISGNLMPPIISINRYG